MSKFVEVFIVDCREKREYVAAFRELQDATSGLSWSQLPASTPQSPPSAPIHTTLSEQQRVPGCGSGMAFFGYFPFLEIVQQLERHAGCVAGKNHSLDMCGYLPS